MEFGRQHVGTIPERFLSHYINFDITIPKYILIKIHINLTTFATNELWYQLTALCVHLYLSG